MIGISNITKRYGNQVVLEETSYKFRNRGITCVLGASGCGKTTLLNLLAGFDTDYEGKILVGGNTITGLKPWELCEYRKNNVGFVFQNYHLLKGYTVLENILLAGELNGKAKEENEAEALRLIKNLGIESKAEGLIENLSGGQKQRVAIARALINNPDVIFADEPTGALDRETSNQIMKLLKELSKKRLVVIITHDKKICDFADDIISIVDGKIHIIQETTEDEGYIEELIEEISITETRGGAVKAEKNEKTRTFHRAIKNYKVHFKKYFAVSLAIAIGVGAFALSTSSKNIMKQSIEDFKMKNTAFNNGYVRGDNLKEDFDVISKDDGVEETYYQYILEDITLSSGENTVEMAEKIPMPKTTENMSYGVMPRKNKNEIALSPSLAKKFNKDIQALIGEELKLKIDGKEVQLLISGIYNAGYDDFFISSDVEQNFYKDKSTEEAFSFSFDMKGFEDVIEVNNRLKSQDISAQTAVKQVEALQSTFESLNRLFLALSILILIIGLFISAMLLIKLTNGRFREVGLLSALGYHRGWIRNILVGENFLLSATAIISNLILLVVASIIADKVLEVSLILKGSQIMFSVILTFVMIFTVGIIAGSRLIRTEPAEALRK